MTKRKIYFRADASATIGYGHFIRTLALADMLKNDFDCTFFTSYPSDYQIEEMGKVCNHVSLNEDTKFEDFIKLLKGDEIVVLDNYFYTTEYQQQIKEKGCKLVCVDDMHDKHYYADVVINHGLTDESLFDVEPYTILCLGFNYALLRSPFLRETEILRKQNSWFISFGGTDFLNLTEKFLKVIHDDSRVNEILVVIGDAYKYTNNLLNYPKARILRNLTAEQMAYELQRSEYVIVPSSTVCIEALALGCKVATGYYIENQKEFSNELALKSGVVFLEDLRYYNGTTLVDDLFNLHKVSLLDFSKIPSHYIEIFKTIGNDN